MTENTQEYLIPNYKEVIMHIKDIIDFPSEFVFSVVTGQCKHMAITVSPTKKEDVLVAKLNYSESMPVFDLNRIYKRLGICMDKAEIVINGMDQIDLLKRFIVIGILHEMGHIHYMSTGFKYGAGRTFITARDLNKHTYKSMNYDSYQAMVQDGYSPAYMLNPDEMYADSFAKDYYDMVMASLINHNLL